MTNETDDPWRLSVEAAHETVRRAQSGDVHAAHDVIRNAAIALKGLMQFDEPDPNKLRLDVTRMDDPRPLVFSEPPDPHRLVYLRSLLVSLLAIDSGTPPTEAFHLTPPSHRLANPEVGLRNALLFVQVGQELERLKARGWTRIDKPVAEAIRVVARNNAVSPETVQKAWSEHGSMDRWESSKSDWN